MKKILLLFGFAFALSPVLGQKASIDSLKHSILKLETDSVNDFSDSNMMGYVQNYPDSGIYYARVLIAYGKKHNERRIIASGLNIFSYALYNKGNYPVALNMAFQSLRIIENSKYVRVIAGTYNLVGNIYKGEQNYPKALYYYMRCKQLAQASHFQFILNAACFNMAFVYKETNVLDSALYYSKLSVYYSTRLHGYYMGHILGTLGDEYFKLKNYKKALEYYQTAYTLDKKNADFRDASMVCLSLARFYNKTGKPDSAIYYARQSLTSAKKVSYNKSVFESAELLSRLYEAKHQPDSGFKYLKLSNVAKDSLYNASKSGEVENLTTNEFLRQSEILAAETAYKNRLRVYALISVLLIFLIAALLQWRYSRQRKKAYTLLQKQKEEIEAQKAQAQIEAALERVRGKAMAMRSSGDLNDTANTVFIELRKLGVDLVRCGLGLMEKETQISTIHAATNSDEGGSLEVLGNIDMNIHPVFAGIYSNWRKNEDYFPVLEGESLKAYYGKLHESGISVPDWKSGEKQYGYFLQFAYGSLYAWSGKQESEITIKTLKRFTSVISLTYTRYIELQKAELNTKEAVKQASLDRVRAEIASMRKRNDLERITPLIWDELTILGIPFIRCGVFIMDEEQQLIHTFLSTPDGKAIGVFHIPFDTSENFEIMVGQWRNKESYIDHWKEEAFSQFADVLVKQGAIASKAQYMRTLPHEGVHLNFLPFLQGMLYVGNIEPLTEDNINLIQAVAEAFSTAYARYEDFNKLEAAKQQVDNTLSDLKATQTRLIQSEKMASLGELTAGIAHEIQNPLNFVNNFSEVNQEMLEELKAESKKPKAERDEQLEIDLINDLIENEQKINHHGKRADAIVKGMLQHSRTGGGEKQPTNINTLADEFMRLSYHGLRAKDKVFTAELVTHFDPDLPKISVIGQDIGRVLLNLFNNAFYAVNQKQKTAGLDYKPEVMVTTSTENGQVIIKVKDNGTGIPDAIKEKIMQPFFTTKPTGEGTGLGLSLTYDMVVKGHGGSIQVNSTEGEGSEFIITLPIK